MLDKDETPREWGVAPLIDSPKYVRDLPQAQMPKKLQALIPASPQDVPRNRVKHALVGNLLIEGAIDIAGKLRMLQFVEDSGNQIDLRAYSVFGARIKRTPGRDTFSIPVPGLAENRPSVLRGDRLKLRDEMTLLWYGGVVHFVDLESVTVSLPRSCRGDSYYNVTFMLNPSQEYIRHRAINDPSLYLTEEKCLRRTTLPRRGVVAGAVVHPTPLNNEQRQFVNCVIQPKGHAVALLWGPPGTGKTTTLVAAIIEVLVRTPPSYCVLVVTPSNDSADLVTERLLHNAYNATLTGNDGKSLLFRFNAAGRTASKAPRFVVDHGLPSQSGGFRYPTIDMLKAFRVVVATLSTSNQLYSLGVADNFFGHVFVDEAGHATEADLLLALQAAPKALRIVLAGDHKQLGPVVRSQACIVNGMDISPLQRLQENEQLRGISVMLTRNYRSDPRIVHLVNAAYDNQLQPQRTRQTMPRGTLSVIFQQYNYRLPMSDNAIVFLHHIRPESRERESPSWQNVDEAELCINIAHELHRVNGVALSDVVILSPYRRQVVRIGQRLHARYRDNTRYIDNTGRVTPPLTASTLEMFQGRERRVVILSSVRNNPELVDGDVRLGLGFVRQPRRANVAVSRSRDVLVVVGNMALMRTDAVWGEYLVRARQGGVVWNLARPPLDDGTPHRWDSNVAMAPPRAPPPVRDPIIDEDEADMLDVERHMRRDE